MKRKPVRLVAKAMRTLNEQVEAMAQATGVPYSDFAYWLLYQCEVATYCVMEKDVESEEDASYGDMRTALEESHDAACDDRGDFIDDHFNEMLRVGRRYDPEFKKPLAKRSDYDKLTKGVK